MSLRLLLSALVALTVLFAPAVTSAAAAESAVPDHQMQMMEAGNCKSMPAKNHNKAPEKSCCIAMCLGLAITHDAPLAEEPPQHAPTLFAVPPLHVSILGEIATPPPRRS